MPKIYYGTSELERGWDRYYERSNLFEISLSGGEHDPSVKTLNRWRVNSPKGFAFVLHATPELSQALVRGHQRDDASWSEDLNAAWEKTTALAHACAAKAILVSTPMEFSPGETSRALIAQLGERAKEIKAALFWESEGLWQPLMEKDWAEEHGVAMAFDPFMGLREGATPGRGDACYIINERAGMRRKFDQYDFEDLLDWSAPYQRVFMLLRGRFGEDHARELQHVLEELER